MLARILTTLVGLPFVAVAVWQGGWWWAALLAAAGALATHEYMRVVQPDAPACRTLAVMASAALPVVARVAGLGGAFVVVVLAGLVAWVLHLRGPDNAAAERGVGDVYASVLLPGGGIVALAVLRELQCGLDWTVLVVATTWTADTGGFLLGRAWGRHRICPRISPNKSWEGLAGGAIAAALVGIALYVAGLSRLTGTDHAIVVVVAAFVGPLGDFSKSMVKRAHGIKDFGRLLPGHGGLLDRIDALVFAAPCVLLWALWLRPPVAAG